jgi:O-antigen/teichoic acid export membrane protein
MVWVSRNAHFGVRSIGGGAAVELNTRADILILGLFSNDIEVGRYSFAAFFVEGLLQIPMLVRRYVDPAITNLVVNGRSTEFADLLRRGRNLNGTAITVIFLLAVLFYPWYAAHIGSPQLMEQSYTIFAVLSVGAAIFGTYAIFTGVLSQGGKPVAQTLYNFKVLGANVVLNLCLASQFEALGAAIATSLSFVVGALLLRKAIAEHYSLRF